MIWTPDFTLKLYLFMKGSEYIDNNEKAWVLTNSNQNLELTGI